MAGAFEPLTQNRDFRRLYNRGKSFVHPGLCVYTMRNRQNKVRVGITAGKKVGNAVKRNRARRVIREGFRQVLPQINSGVDIVFVARGRTPDMKSTALTPVMAKTLSVHGYLK